MAASFGCRPRDLSVDCLSSDCLSVDCLGLDLLSFDWQAYCPADRLVVTLVHLKEKSVAEASALTGWSCAGVKVRAFRARKRLQKILKQLEKRHERR